MAPPVPPTGAGPIFGCARLSEAEVREALIRTSPVLRFRWAILAVSAVGVVLAVPRFDGKGPNGWLDIAPFIVVLAVFFTMILLGPRTNARKILKALGAEGEIDYRFDGEGMTIRAPGTSSTVSYRVITRYRETALTFLVYSSPGLANVVPKRAFAGADVDGVRALLEANVRPAGATEGKR
jgi:hypothetical protein